MAELFNISDAARLGLHAALVLAREPDRRVTISALAKELGGSAAHLAKVLVQLERAGIVKGKTGPAGGYQLAPGGENLSLFSVYQTVEGRLVTERCPLSIPVCAGSGCPLGPYLRKINRLVIGQMRRVKLKDIKIRIGGGDEGKKKNH